MTDPRRMVDAQEKPLLQDAWRSGSEKIDMKMLNNIKKGEKL